MVVESLGDPASSISRKIIGLIKKEIDDVFMPIATVKEKGKLEAEITKLYNVEDEKEYVALFHFLFFCRLMRGLLGFCPYLRMLFPSTIALCQNHIHNDHHLFHAYMRSSSLMSHD